MTLELTTSLHEKYRYIYNETVKNRLKYIYFDYYGTQLIYQPINQHENSLEFFMDLFQAMRILKSDMLTNIHQMHRRFIKELNIMKQKRRQIIYKQILKHENKLCDDMVAYIVSFLIQKIIII